VIDNLSTSAMPISIGFHPYFQLTDAAAAMTGKWLLPAAVNQLVLSNLLIPTR